MEENTTGHMAGRRIGHFGVRRDTSESPRMAQEERRRVEHLALLGKLASTVAHDIRNPLHTIFLYVDVLEEELRQPSANHYVQMAASVADIRTELTHLYNVVEDSLTLVCLASLRREPTTLEAFVETFGADMEERLTHHGVALHLEGLERLGQVAIHTSTLRRALFNLVQNALDAMSDGGTLTLRGQRTVSHISLEISDTGRGISAEDVPLIFTPLYTTKPAGTGLELSIVQEIVVAHGGTITVRSAPGIGTTFTIVLPCLEAEVEPPCREEQA